MRPGVRPLLALGSLSPFLLTGASLALRVDGRLALLLAFLGTTGALGVLLFLHALPQLPSVTVELVEWEAQAFDYPGYLIGPVVLLALGFALGPALGLLGLVLLGAEPAQNGLFHLLGLRAYRIRLGRSWVTVLSSSSPIARSLLTLVPIDEVTFFALGN